MRSSEKGGHSSCRSHRMCNDVGVYVRACACVQRESMFQKVQPSKLITLKCSSLWSVLVMVQNRLKILLLERRLSCFWQNSLRKLGSLEFSLNHFLKWNSFLVIYGELKKNVSTQTAWWNMHVEVCWYNVVYIQKVLDQSDDWNLAGKTLCFMKRIPNKLKHLVF